MKIGLQENTAPVIAKHGRKGFWTRRTKLNNFAALLSGAKGKQAKVAHLGATQPTATKATSRELKISRLLKLAEPPTTDKPQKFTAVAKRTEPMTPVLGKLKQILAAEDAQVKKQPLIKEDSKEKQIKEGVEGVLAILNLDLTPTVKTTKGKGKAEVGISKKDAAARVVSTVVIKQDQNTVKAETKMALKGAGEKQAPTIPMDTKPLKNEELAAVLERVLADHTKKIKAASQAGTQAVTAPNTSKKATRQMNAKEEIHRILGQGDSDAPARKTKRRGLHPKAQVVESDVPKTTRNAVMGKPLVTGPKQSSAMTPDQIQRELMHPKESLTPDDVLARLDLASRKKEPEPKGFTSSESQRALRPQVTSTTEALVTKHKESKTKATATAQVHKVDPTRKVTPNEIQATEQTSGETPAFEAMDSELQVQDLKAKTTTARTTTRIVTPGTESQLEQQVTTNQVKAEAPVRTDAKPKETPRPPQPMFRQLENGLREAYVLRPGSVTVKITPEELGEVKIKVTVEKDQIQAKIHTESEKVASIIKEHQAELEQRLREKGIDLDQLEVKEERKEEAKDEANQGLASQSQWQERQSQQGREAGDQSEVDENAPRKEDMTPDAQGNLIPEQTEVVDGQPFSFVV